MSDKEKTKEELIAELKELRKKVAERTTKVATSTRNKIAKKTQMRKLTDEEMEQLKKEKDYSLITESKPPLLEGQSRVVLQPHQKKIIEAFILSNLRSGILFHGVGTGKTFSAVGLMKAYLQLFPENKIILITPPALLFGFVNSLIAYGLNPQDKRFEYYSYTSFVNYNVDTTNSMMVIDEAHNLRTKIELVEQENLEGDVVEVATEGKTSYKTIVKSKNAHKIVMLTATPFVNKPYDIENLLAIGDSRIPYGEDVFANVVSDNEGRYDYFKYRISKHFNPPNDPNFPDKIEKLVPIPVERGSKIGNSIIAVADRVENSAYIRSRFASINNSKLKYIAKILKKNPTKKYCFYTSFKWVIKDLQKALSKITKKEFKKRDEGVVITGGMTKINKAKAIDAYNNAETNYLIFTRAGAEGVSLIETRGIFILDGVWNEALYIQIVARAVRYKSHANLPENERFVNVYKLLTCYEDEIPDIKKINKSESSFNFADYMESVLGLRKQLSKNRKAQKYMKDEEKFDMFELQKLKKGSKERKEYLKEKMTFAKGKDKFLTQELFQKLQGIPSVDFYMFCLQKNKQLIIDSLITELENVPHLEDVLKDIPNIKELYKKIEGGELSGKKIVKLLRKEQKKRERKVGLIISREINKKESKIAKFIEKKKDIKDAFKKKMVARIKQEFFTPKKFVLELIELSKIGSRLNKGSPVSILEPSAGWGNIVKELLNIATYKRNMWEIDIDMVEIVKENRKSLKELEKLAPSVLNLQKEPDFIQFLSSKKYDYCFMNPPFHLQKRHNKQYNQDVYSYHFLMRAYAMLKKNGRLVAITGREWENSELAQEFKKNVVATTLNRKVEWTGKDVKKGGEVKKLKITYWKIDKLTTQYDNDYLLITDKLLVKKKDNKNVNPEKTIKKVIQEPTTKPLEPEPAKKKIKVIKKYKPYYKTKKKLIKKGIFDEINDTSVNIMLAPDTDKQYFTIKYSLSQNPETPVKTTRNKKVLEKAKQEAVKIFYFLFLSGKGEYYSIKEDDMLFDDKDKFIGVKKDVEYKIGLQKTKAKKLKIVKKMDLDEPDEPEPYPSYLKEKLEKMKKKEKPKEKKEKKKVKVIKKEKPEEKKEENDWNTLWNIALEEAIPIIKKLYKNGKIYQKAFDELSKTDIDKLKKLNSMYLSTNHDPIINKFKGGIDETNMRDIKNLLFDLEMEEGMKKSVREEEYGVYDIYNEETPMINLGSPKKMSVEDTKKLRNLIAKTKSLSASPFEKGKAEIQIEKLQLKYNQCPTWLETYVKGIIKEIYNLIKEYKRNRHVPVNTLLKILDRKLFIENQKIFTITIPEANKEDVDFELPTLRYLLNVNCFDVIKLIEKFLSEMRLAGNYKELGFSKNTYKKVDDDLRGEIVSKILKKVQDEKEKSTDEPVDEPVKEKPKKKVRFDKVRKKTFKLTKEEKEFKKKSPELKKQLKQLEKCKWASPKKLVLPCKLKSSIFTNIDELIDYIKLKLNTTTDKDKIAKYKRIIRALEKMKLKEKPKEKKEKTMSKKEFDNVVDALQEMDKLSTSEPVLYSSLGAFSYLMLLHTLKENKNDCIVRDVTSKKGLPLFIKYSKGSMDKSSISDEQIEKIAEAYKNCKKEGKILVIPLKLLTSVGGHENAIIINYHRNEVERFEPHGSVTGGSFKLRTNVLDNGIKKIVKKLNKNYKLKLKYVPATETCPTGLKGYQTYEGEALKKFGKGKIRIGDYKGYCMAWSNFYNNLRLKFPKKSASELNTEGIKYFKENPEKMREFIRGQVLFIEKEFDKLLGKNKYRDLVNIANKKKKTYNDDIEIKSLTDELEEKVSREFIKFGGSDKSSIKLSKEKSKDELIDTYLDLADELNDNYSIEKLEEIMLNKTARKAKKDILKYIKEVLNPQYNELMLLGKKIENNKKVDKIKNKLKTFQKDLGVRVNDIFKNL